MTPQQNLNARAFEYVCALAVTNRFQALERLGIKRDQIQRLRALTAEELHLIGTLPNSAVELRIDPVALDHVFTNVERRRNERRLEVELIRAGASRNMMEILFGMRGQEFVDTREFLGVKGEGNGRHRKPDLATEDALWRAWRSLSGTDHPDDLEPAELAERMLTIHETTGTSVRTIWHFLRTVEIREHRSAGGAAIFSNHPHYRTQESPHG